MNYEKLLIEPSVRPVLCPQALEIIEFSRFVLVSAQPMVRSEPEMYYNNCEYVFDEKVRPLSLRLHDIPEFGHRHLNPKFFGKYPVLWAVTEKNDDVMYALNSAFGFEIKTAEC